MIILYFLKKRKKLYLLGKKDDKQITNKHKFIIYFIFLYFITYLLYGI